MFKLAVEAELPLIAVQTDDPLNIHIIMEHILEKSIRRTSTKSVKENGIYIYSHEPQDWGAVYKSALNMDSVFIVINPKKIDPCMYDAGFVECPTSFLENYVGTFHIGDGKKQIVQALSGLSFKNIRELCQITYKKYGEIKKENLDNVRRNFFTLPTGLIDITKDELFYVPNDKVVKWLEKESPFFIRSPMDCLKPRGLIFDGSPGVGKTLGAQYIAKELGVPIYLLDIGTIMNKYVGESEKNLDACLRTISSLSPCVMLMDEVEKIFTGSSNDTSTRLLGRLLWWLQSRESDTLTIMTTNDIDKIPPELWRPGRIDKKIWFSELSSYKDVPSFTQSYLNTFQDLLNPEDITAIYNDVCNKATSVQSVSHSKVVQWVLTSVKEKLL